MWEIALKKIKLCSHLLCFYSLEIDLIQGMKFTQTKDKNLHILCKKYDGYRQPRDKWSQVISRHGIDLIHKQLD